jgi:uncharacterized membrane protein YhaH (DUF805 family)
MHWYLKVLRQYADFTGRARRREFWMFTLFNALIMIGLMILTGALAYAFDTGSSGSAGSSVFAGVTWLYWLATVIPTMAVSVRRLHDTERSGWFLLLSLIPLIGPIVLLVFYAVEGTPGQNSYGPDPKAEVTASAAEPGYPAVTSYPPVTGYPTATGYPSVADYPAPDQSSRGQSSQGSNGGYPSPGEYPPPRS